MKLSKQGSKEGRNRLKRCSTAKKESSRGVNSREVTQLVKK